MHGRVNTDECESILFRPSIKITKYPTPQQYKLFKLKENAIGNKTIQHKTKVRYFGILLDERLLYNFHIKIYLNIY